MKGFVREMEDAFVAIAFSESGEHGTAMEFLTAPSVSARAKTTVGNHSRPHMPSTPEGDHP